jgi:predicted dehydrogenase
MKNKGKQINVLNVGVVGMGGRGRYLAQCFAERPQLALKAVCDSDPASIPVLACRMPATARPSPSPPRNHRPPTCR